MADARATALADYRRALLAAREGGARLSAAREKLKATNKKYDKTEDDLKALQVRA